MTEGVRGTKEACSIHCSTAAFCSEVTLSATDNFVQHPGPDTLTSQINIILPGATRLLPKLYVFLAAGRVSGSADQKGCKKSHYVDIYLIQFSVPYVFKRLKKQIRYSRHGEDIFQCSFMSVFFGNNVQCGVVHSLSIMLVVSHNLCVSLILINNYGQYHFVNLIHQIKFKFKPK